MLHEKLIINDFAPFRHLTFFEKFCSIYFERKLEGKDSLAWFIIKYHKNDNIVHQEGLSVDSINKIIEFLKEVRDQKLTKK